MTFTNLLLSCAQKSLKLAQSPIEIIYEFVGRIVTFRKRRVYELCNPLLLGMYDFLHVAIPFIGYVFVKRNSIRCPCILAISLYSWDEKE